MIDSPIVVTTEPTLFAKIHLAIAWSQMREVMGPAIGEVKASVAAQRIGAPAPWFIHYLKVGPALVDFEVCVPVIRAVAEAGRVTAGAWPATRVAWTTYHGGYESLAGGWSDFKAWMKSKGHRAGAGFWEIYAAGPETNASPRHWRTHLLLPLLD
jgi:effector-binding domain-containing protein